MEVGEDATTTIGQGIRTIPLECAWVASRERMLIGLMRGSRFRRTTNGLICVSVLSIVLFRCALGTSVNRRRIFHYDGIVADVISERSVVGKRVLVAARWVSSRGTWHEIERGYLWILVGMDLNLVSSVTVLLTETWYLLDLTADVWTHYD